MPIELIPNFWLVVEFLECYLAGTFDYFPPQLLVVKLYGEAVIPHHSLPILRRLCERLGLAVDKVASYLNPIALTEGVLTVVQKNIPQHQQPLDSRNWRYLHRPHCPTLFSRDGGLVIGED